MFAQLGDHRFEGLKTPASFSGSEAVQFGQIARINRKPVVQPTGRELAELSLTLRFTTDFCEPSEEIEALRGSMQRFEVLPYITGEGRIVGKFVITTLDVTAERCGADGRVEMATVTSACWRAWARTNRPPRREPPCRAAIPWCSRPLRRYLLRPPPSRPT